MIGTPRRVDEHGLESRVWYPAIDEDSSDAATTEDALRKLQVAEVWLNRQPVERSL